MLPDVVPRDGPVLAVEPELWIAGEGIAEAADGAEQLCQHGGDGRARDAPVERDDEQQVQPDVQRRGEQEEQQRRDRIAQAAEEGADEVVEQLRADAGEDDRAVGECGAMNLAARGREVDQASIGFSSTSASAVSATVSAAERTICVASERRTAASSCAPTLRAVTAQKPAR